MDVVNEKLGAEGSMSVRIEGKKIIVSAKHEHASGYVQLESAEDLVYFLEKLKPLLPAWATIGINLAEAAIP